MIKAVVFDFGGVIVLNGPDNLNGGLLAGIADIVGVSASDFKTEYFKHNHLSNVENVPWEEMIIKVISAFTADEKIKSKALAFSQEYYSQRRINHDLLALLPALKQKGLKVGILSNATSQLRQELEREGISSLVDEVVISGEIGFQKPSKEAFGAVFEKLQVRPEEVAFVDDTEKSLEQAAEIGYTPILFKNNDQLKEELEVLGILPG